VRVNLLKTTITAVFDHFKSSGFIFIENYFQGELKKKHFAKDSLLNDLFILPASADLHEDFFYKEGLIIIQDKASCFPAHVLRPPIGSSVIDACAAPGNKTSHLAAFMNNTGIIYAFDLNKNRLKTLRKLHARAGVTCNSFTLLYKYNDLNCLRRCLETSELSGSGSVGPSIC
jgi:putative methyltransferase